MPLASYGLREKGSDMPQGTPLVEAAEILGVSADSLRKRARRGTVEAYKQGEEWYVIVPNGTSRSQATSQATARARQATDEPLQRAVAEVIALLRDQIKTKDVQIAQKDVQLAERDKQLAAREREVSELHVLLQTTQRLIPSITSDGGDSPDRHTTKAPESFEAVSQVSEPKQPVSWWRRVFLGET